MAVQPAKVVSLSTCPYDDQKPGTSGLRKTVPHFQQKNYMANFIQSFFDTLPGGKPCRLFVGGDGRFLMADCIRLVVKMAAANGISEINVAVNGICSTPAASHIIRSLKLDAGLILTASHNPGGAHGDFGIKFNGSNGGPAQESWTDAVFEVSRALKQYKICEEIVFDLNTIGQYIMHVENLGEFRVNVIDCVAPYHDYMKQIFDFPKIRAFLKEREFRITANCLHGVMGPYVKRMMVSDLGMDPEDAIKCDPLEDFGGQHPDPNTTYAKELLDRMRENKHDLGFAFDGDGDRNMLVGKNAYFVNPCDSLAVIGSYLECIPYFKEAGKITGFARSMPTSQAIDVVAEKMGLKCYETAKQQNWAMGPGGDCF